MKISFTILFIIVTLNIVPVTSHARVNNEVVLFDFYGDPVEFEFDPVFRVDFNDALSAEAIQAFYKKITSSRYESILNALTDYKERHKPDDWLYYQLIRKAVQQVSPKTDNYFRYTLYKWFLLTKSGYDAILSIGNNRLLFYVQSDENIYNIPYRIRNGKQYVCLNYHDYGAIDFEKERFAEIAIAAPGERKAFSYKVTQLPEFSPLDYVEKDVSFNYNMTDYRFKLKINPEVKSIFANYPVVDYEWYFNIPLSAETYGSLIPSLKKAVKGMNTKNGVDYLMRFTRYAFLFKPDTENFGGEKRLSPEQTLLYEQSDCDDRAALFFFVVKEIYNLPMIVLAYPKHVTIAVQFDKPVGKPIVYKGNRYYICEPTPQKEDLSIGQSLPELKKAPYEIVYAYQPQQK